jgi:hypothetical protein
MLLKLNLPGFTEENWRSSIRKEVRVHEKYCNMEPWNGAETADIVYQDFDGHFTELLIGEGYLPSAIWRHATPTYYLEVKTTTRQGGERFFMSKGQYQRVSRDLLIYNEIHES